VHRTRIKICGVTRLDDALTAAQLGADAIGLICHEQSPRYVPPDRAREIVQSLPPFVTPVGVFVNADATTIIETADDLGLDAVQLNGHEPAALIADLFPLGVIKAIRIDPEKSASELAGWRTARSQLAVENLTAFVLEPSQSSAPGGSGIANDWTTVRHLIDTGAFSGLPPLIAAGGLTPETVADVIRQIRPWAVDVSSGVEESKGVKSRGKLQAFIDAVRWADASIIV